MTDIELLADENDMYELSRWVANLGTISKEKESVCKESSEKLWWLGESNNGNIRNERARSTIERGRNDIKLPLSESLYLLRERTWASSRGIPNTY